MRPSSFLARLRVADDHSAFRIPQSAIPSAILNVLCGLGLFVSIAFSAPTCLVAAEHVGPTSSQAAQQEAIKAIPWNELRPQDRRAVYDVIQNPTIYRRLPTRIIDCDPELFTFLAQHPEVIVDTWRVMGVSKVSLRRTQPGTYFARDDAGTTGHFHFVKSTWQPGAQNLALIYAHGSYEGQPLPGSVNARCVLLMRSGSVQETNGRHYVTVQVDSFVVLERLDAELLAKTIRPWMYRTADHNFIETLTFVSQFSRAAEKNPERIELLAERLTDVDQPTRAQLVEICRQTADRHASVDRESIHLVQAEQESPAPIP